MKCIFCEQDSSRSKSVEHIIPESLGNTEHVLPRGIVCDTCNNYFARKIEKPLLDSDYFTHLRQRQQLRNKRGRIPPVEIVIPKFRSKATLFHDGDSVWFEGRNDIHTDELTQSILASGSFTAYSPLPSHPDKKIMSRFLAKISVEAMVAGLMRTSSWEVPYFADRKISALRRYVRQGDKPNFWPFHERRIYHENEGHHDGGDTYQVLHEWQFLYTDRKEMYCIVAIFGQEYSFNVGGPDISGYERWLRKNKSQSPLYPNKKKEIKK